MVWAPLLALALAGTPAEAPRSIYELHPAVDVPVIVGSLAVVGFAYLDSSRLITPRCPCDTSGIPGFDRWAVGNHNVFADTTSDVTAGLALATPFVLSLADDQLSPELVEDATVDAEALSVAGALVTVAKYAVQRPLPRVYALQDPKVVGSPGGYRSFYSGHTTLVSAALVASASQWQRRHGPSVWPWLGAGLVVTSVAVERVAAGRHFPSDVVVGAAMGTGVGLLVPWLHARPQAGQLGVAPAPGGAVAVWTRSLDLGAVSR